jgi:4-hydroxybenzoate polyprenyltransferase
MNSVKKRRPADILRGFFWLCHPGPVLLNVTAVTIFALLATWPHIHWNILLLVIAAHLAMQLSIASFNDYCDRQRDVLSKKNKPIVRGLILPREALLATIFLMLIMVLLLIPLNPLALLISLLYLACGQSYNMGLKTTPLSGIVFALAIPLIPLYAFVGVGRFMPLVLWQMPIAALLGVALHLANALPDIEQDVANQVHNLVVVLGIKGSLVACSLLILLAAIVTGVLAITGLVPAQPWILLPTLLLVILAVSILFIVFISKKSHQAHQTYFYLVVLTCLVLAGGWLTSALV